MTTFRNNIEKQFEHAARWIFRHPFIVFAIVLPILGLLFSQLPKITVDTSIEGFLHEKDPSLLAYNDFRDEFGRDEMVLVALKPPNVFDTSFLKKLRIIHDDMEANVPYLEEITSMINARNTRGEKDELIVGDLLETFPQTDEEPAILKKRVFDNPLYLNTLVSRDGKFRSTHGKKKHGKRKSSWIAYSAGSKLYPPDTRITFLLLHPELSFLRYWEY